MVSEARRGFTRIATNYSRLFFNLGVGLVLVPLLIAWVGLEGFGLISLIGASTGIVALFRELINECMTRELGTAYHSEDEEIFLRYYNSSYIVTIVCGLLVIVAFGALTFALPLFNIPEGWIGAARIMVVAQGVYATMLVVLAPAKSMYFVKEQFGLHNTWMAMTRASGLVAAVVLVFGFRITDTADALAWYGILVSVLQSIVYLVFVGFIIASDQRLHPRTSHIHREAIRQITRTIGWNGTVHIGITLFFRCPAILMNLAFGVYGSGVYEISYRLVAYIRMFTTGVTHGLEAVSARVSTKGEGFVIGRLLHQYTRLQALVALPAGLGVLVLAEPLIRFWIGRHLDDPALTIPITVIILRILVIASIVRAISHGWIQIMYGAGMVRKYAPYVLVGGIFSPLIGVLLLYILPEPFRFYAPAIGLTIMFTFVYGVQIPLICMRNCHVGSSELILSMVRPLLVTVGCAPILFAPTFMYDEWNLTVLLVTIAAYGCCYLPLAWFIAIDRDERKRAGNALYRAVVRKTT